MLSLYKNLYEHIAMAFFLVQALDLESSINDIETDGIREYILQCTVGVLWRTVRLNCNKHAQY